MFVNGELVDDELIRVESAALRQEFRAQFPLADEIEIGLRAHEFARRNIIDRTLLRLAALNLGTPLPVETVEAAVTQRTREYSAADCLLPADHLQIRESVELELRISQLLHHITVHVPRPKPNELKAYFNANRHQFAIPDLVHAAHIVKNVDETTNESESLAEMHRIAGLLSNGAIFEAVADQLSDCPGQGGDLGFFARGQMVEEFESAVFALVPGQISKIFRSPFGFHIVKLYERTPARLQRFDEVRETIMNTLWEERKQNVISAYLADLRSRAEVRKSRLPEE